MNRNEFIKSAGRTVILAGMAGIVAVFYQKDQLSLYADCQTDIVCKKCNRLTTCALPDAKKERDNG
ncbi:MAG: hypothetical protein PF450_08235 [Bacteroidales bacterium]|jgi:Fe2+ or Zn2+ uptake regulation protein|nr:hypothetical protein [Bacteroidales bacterium]